MNRQSFPREIADPDLNDRGLHIFYGCDDSTIRQVEHMLSYYEELSQLVESWDGQTDYSSSDRLYTLTASPYEQYISHAVAHLGALGLKVYRFDECTDDDEKSFRRVIDTHLETEYTTAS